MTFVLALIVGLLVWLATASVLYGLVAALLTVVAVLALSSPRARP